jgi:molybdenum cofactor biosynthesis enzyme MoaA
MERIKKLEDIGFYTLENERAKNVSLDTDLWRCELILTDICNFKCPYCRGMEKENKGSISWEEAKFIIDMWSSNNLRNVRFSGGEPTLWFDRKAKKELKDIISYAKEKGIKRIAISTNGSMPKEKYLELYEAGVSDFSISLDACCAEVGDEMAGGVKGSWNVVVDNIRELSKLTYVTVGVVFTETNVKEFKDLISFASDDLGVADIRILSSAQWNEKFKDIDIDKIYLDKHPILKYRINHFQKGIHVRGLEKEDSNRCDLMLDDMAILKGKHYPCIIFLREQGKHIGEVDYSLSPEAAIKKIREERKKWIEENDTYCNEVCKKNCLDVCIDYNNKVKELK